MEKDRGKFNIKNERLEKNYELLRKSLIEKVPLTITYYTDVSMVSFKGIIESFHPIDKELLLKDKNQNIKKLLVKNIAHVQE